MHKIIIDAKLWALFIYIIVNKNMSKKKIGILNSGGDAPGLNAVIASIVRTGSENFDFIGFENGFEGLLNGGTYQDLGLTQVKGIAHKGGTILGTVNKGNFASKVLNGVLQPIKPEIIADVKATVAALDLSALVVLGGDGSLTTAMQLMEAGIPVIGVPKTIDNDLLATEVTFGFQSTVEYVHFALDRLHDTMTSHKRVMVVEIMGRHVGWIALHGGIAGGADMVLIPEIPFSYEKIVDVIKHRNNTQKRAMLIAVAEGAHATDEEQQFTKTLSGAESRLGGIAQKITAYLEQALPEVETRSVVLGHVQRGGSPVAFDRIVSFQFGYKAVELLRQEKYGFMPAVIKGEVSEVSLAEAVKYLKHVEADTFLVRTARAMGISFGD